jgi:hypothetical protein
LKNKIRRLLYFIFLIITGTKPNQIKREMKKLLTFLMLVSFSAFGQTIDSLDKKNGFKNFKLGSSVQGYQTLKFIKKEGDLKYYNILTQQKIGTCITKSLMCVFYKGKLSKILVEMKSTSDAYALYHILEDAYGTPQLDNKNKYDLEYYWYGNKVNLTYLFSKNMLLFSSVDLEEEEVADQEKINKKAKGDL